MSSGGDSLAAACASEPSAVYGPVHSWRFGRSLGIDLLLHRSTCSFSCIYCQLGPIEVPSETRALFVPTGEVVRDLDRSAWREAEVLTFSGSGEPTLALNLGEAIRAARAATSLPTIVLTNALLLDDPRVRAEVGLADQVCCKLDAAEDESLHRINRPLSTAVSVEKIVRGIIALRSEAPSRLSVQIMMTAPTLRAIHRFVPLLERIRPDQVQLNLVSRPVPGAYRLPSRGDHGTFAAERAWRGVSRSSLVRAKRALEASLGLPVVIPPSLREER